MSPMLDGTQGKKVKKRAKEQKRELQRKKSGDSKNKQGEEFGVLVGKTA